ncbi:hypothetical protein NPIL_583251 [Nephila pilipes]|uniref:Uncharacterized protein n=1 Tax=Nephila pilipes TaxID=299642 RepID=A0A8X6PDA8_NEPPI|nr:hypothetical protein NPIL_583251 [Nephila pilipes]
MKTLQVKNDELSSTLSNIQQIQTRRRSRLDGENNKLYSSESVIRNLQKELENLKLENDSLFYQLQRIKEKAEVQKNSCNCKVDKMMKIQNKKKFENHRLHFQSIYSEAKSSKNLSLKSNETVNEKLEEDLFKQNASFNCSSLNILSKSQNKEKSL